MTKKLLNGLSLGERYPWASILYAGLSLLLLGIAPELPKAFACDNSDCPEGQISVQYGESCECECPDPDDE
ncbi:hypothetical protein FACS189427_11830 [Planctomycetales bacterium]|nr:hypothetical protein FACS189427_11830 [Planctomycetales bacterium]